jgi:hypothetical protein
MAEEQPQEMDLGARWKEELATAKRWLQSWHDSAHKILKRLKDKGERKEGERRVNLFTAEYLTKRAVLYGKTPQANVSRRWKDPEDDLARVAGEMLSRQLNDDISSGDDGYERALGYALEDRLSVGMGQGRVRYEVETEEEDDAKAMAKGDGDLDRQGTGNAMGGSAAHQMGSGLGAVSTQRAHVPQNGAPGGNAVLALTEPSGALSHGVAPTQPIERKSTESVKVDYVYWGDFLYSPCKYWEVCRWVAFGADMGRRALKARFDKRRFPTVRVEGDKIPLDVNNGGDQRDGQPPPPWARAKVWEIWDRDERRVVWVTDGGLVLDVQDDPLGLAGFFPCPRPFFALTTTDELLPRPDFVLAEDLYDDLDTLATRMHLLRTALRVVGVYDQSNGELAELINDSAENRMVGVRNWPDLMGKGGLQGAVQFFPIQEVASALMALSGEFDRLKLQLYEVTGMSDILRGQGSAVATTYGEQRIKAQFGSARLQSVQDEFARFATALQALKAEVIAKQFEPEEIVRSSNMAFTSDSAIALDAAMFLKDNENTFRVKVQPESLALSDFAQTQQERMEVVQAIGQFLSTAMPLVQVMPTALPALVEILQWLVASLRGASEIEGVLDRAKSMWEQAQNQPKQAQPPAPDPKLELAKFNASAKERQIALESEARQKEIASQAMADNRREVVQREQNVMETLQEALIQRLIDQGWTPPSAGGAPPATPPVPPLPPASSMPPGVPPMGGMP